MKTPSIVKWAAVVTAALVFTACGAYTPYTYNDERETMQGPGLFSGEDGVFTIYGRKTAAPAAEADEGSKDTDDDIDHAGP